jgi:RNA recognition motif-containing protein
MNIYVRNISYTLNEEELKSTFGRYGEVSSAKIITDRDTGRSRGFGFVEMPNDSEGQQAIEALDGQAVKGRNIGVSEARQRQ